jgi:hypothetical protein
MDMFESVEGQLPWGFHDALLVRVGIDWVQASLKMDLRVATTEKQDEDRLGQLTFGDLVFCAIDAPELDEARGYVAMRDDGLRVSCGEGVGHESRRDTIPAIPTGAFLRWFFVQDWNRFIHVCAKHVQFTWLEETSRPRAPNRQAHFAGEDI